METAMARVIEPYFVVEYPEELDQKRVLARLEKCGRTCYKSEGKIGPGSAEKLIRSIIARGHESVLEHEKITVRIICDRGVTHELVRHRIAAYSQESTRFCNYSEDQFGNQITVIRPVFWRSDMPEYAIWLTAMDAAEKSYFELMDHGATPQEARSVLPNSLKTEIVVSYNLREWRHVFTLRCSRDAHPQMRQIMIPLHGEFKEKLPVIFSDIDPS
jgi:thymidylate synthase (FAD)